MASNVVHALSKYRFLTDEANETDEGNRGDSFTFAADKARLCLCLAFAGWSNN